ncbi:f86e0419-7b05-446b-979e-77e1e9f147dd [Sclerotinia trifoliorum]|uniref:F86e0419-7b05-446b-979e-77e1e9f147dd n=1 Tax=Sclerotinia trifoliorum TaxID=28548 RepID=A0A8H2VZM6_9HELO|nr:f86e0419-7b05-446b-979e-77e1e9f147dd [Sclerotinia trifoliorum]
MGPVINSKPWTKSKNENGPRNCEEESKSRTIPISEEIDNILEKYETPKKINKYRNLVIIDASDSDEAGETSKVTTQTKALTTTRTSSNDESLESISKVFNNINNNKNNNNSNNSLRQTSYHHCTYERFSGEGLQIPCPRLQYSLFDNIESIGSNLMIPTFNQSRMNLQHISKTDGDHEARIEQELQQSTAEMKSRSNSSVCHITDLEEAKTKNIQKVPHLEKTEKPHANHGKSIIQHINDFDGSDTQSAITGVNDAPEEEDIEPSKTGVKTEWGFKIRYYSSIQDRTKMVRRNLNGGTKPVNRLGDRQSGATTSQTRGIEPFNFHDDRPSKKQRTEQAPPSHGKYGGPNQLEQGASQESGGHKLFQGEPPDTCASVEEFNTVERIVRPKPRRPKRHATTTRTINGSSGGPGNNRDGAHIKPSRQNDNSRSRSHTNGYLEDSDDPIVDDDPHTLISGSQTSPQVIIPSYVGTSNLKPARQNPHSRADGSHRSLNYQKLQTSKKSSSNFTQERRALKELHIDDTSEDELSQVNPPGIANGNHLNKAQEEGKANDSGSDGGSENEPSLVKTGDITPTKWGNRGTGDRTLRQLESYGQQYRVRSVFSRSRYWYRPDNSSKSWYVGLDQCGFVKLLVDTKPDPEFSIKAASILGIKAGHNSRKLIIRKSMETGPMQDSEMFIEFDSPSSARNFRNSLPIPEGVRTYCMEESEIDQTFHHAREILDKRAVQAVNKRNRAESHPEDIQLLASNQKRRTAQLIQSPRYEIQQPNSTHPPKAKRQKLHERMQTPDTPQNMNDNLDPIDATEFYSRSSQATGTRASLRSSDRPKQSKPAPKARTPSPERWSEINKAWVKEWNKSVVYPRAGKKTATVDKQDIHRLDDGEFLNDNLIMFYLLWLEQQHPELANRVYVHNTFFYASLTKAAKGKRGINYEAVERWTAKVDLLSYDYIIVPVNENTHWYVAIICNAPKLLDLEKKEQLDSTEKDAKSEMDGEVESLEDSKSPTPSRSQQSVPMRSVSEMDDNGVDSSFKGLSLLSGEETKTPLDIEHAESLLPSNDRLPTISPDVDRGNISANKAATNVINLAESSSPTAKLNFGTKGKRLPPTCNYDTKQPRIVTFDSLALKHPSTCFNLRDYIVAEIKSKKGISIIPPKAIGMAAKTQAKDDDTGRYLGKGLPEQGNFCDCGVYLLSYMEEFFERPDDFIEDIMENKYEVHGDRNNTPAFRTKIRELLFQLQEEQTREAIAAKKAKIAKKQKGIPLMTKDKVEPLDHQIASFPLSSSDEQPPASTASPVAERGNQESLTEAARIIAKSLPISRGKEVISIEDSQDNLQGKSEEDTAPSFIKEADHRTAEKQPRSRGRDGKPRQTTSTGVRSSPPKPDVPIEIRDSFEDQESTQENADNESQQQKGKDFVIELDKDESHTGKAKIRQDSQSGTQWFGNVVGMVEKYLNKSAGPTASKDEVSGPAPKSPGQNDPQALKSSSRVGMNTPQRSKKEMKPRQLVPRLRSPLPEQVDTNLSVSVGSYSNSDVVDLTEDGADQMLLDQDNSSFPDVQVIASSPLMAGSQEPDRSNDQSSIMAQFGRKSNTLRGEDGYKAPERFRHPGMEGFINSQPLSGRDSVEAAMISQFKH